MDFRLLQFLEQAAIGVMVATLISMGIMQHARSRDLGQWEATDADVRKWYGQLMQPDDPEKSCCGEADAYWADSFEMSPNGEYVAILTDERTVPGRPSRTVGTKIIVPNHKIKFDRGNPTGHGVIFLMPESEYVYCYVAPGGV